MYNLKNIEVSTHSKYFQAAVSFQRICLMIFYTFVSVNKSQKQVKMNVLSEDNKCDRCVLYTSINNLWGVIPAVRGHKVSTPCFLAIYRRTKHWTHKYSSRALNGSYAAVHNNNFPIGPIKYLKIITTQHTGFGLRFLTLSVLDGIAQVACDGFIEAYLYSLEVSQRHAESERLKDTAKHYHVNC